MRITVGCISFALKKILVKRNYIYKYDFSHKEGTVIYIIPDKYIR